MVVSSNRPTDLAVFDHGVFELSEGVDVVGHLSTVTEPIWSPFRRRHRVWLLLTWVDGRRERIVEDYQPWTLVHELQSGRLSWEGRDLTARALQGDERATAWEACGIKDEVGAYL